MNGDDVLVEVPRAQVPQVLAELKEDWPDSLVAYNMLSNAHTWETQEPEKSFQVFRPSSSSAMGIYIIIVPYLSYVSLWAPASDAALTALQDVLSRTGRIEWSTCDRLIFAGLSTSLQAVLDRVLASKGIVPSYNEHCTAYWMPASLAVALELNCPQGMHFGRLDQSHAELINSWWQYSTAKTLNMMRDVLRLNPCWGVFEDGSGQLAAWCLVMEYGVGVLRTEERHRGKGCGRAVAARVLQHLGERGVPAHLHVESTNTPAHRLFLGLGCLPMGEVSWTKLGSESFLSSAAPKPWAAGGSV